MIIWNKTNLHGLWNQPRLISSATIETLKCTTVQRSHFCCTAFLLIPKWRLISFKRIVLYSSCKSVIKCKMCCIIIFPFACIRCRAPAHSPSPWIILLNRCLTTWWNFSSRKSPIQERSISFFLLILFHQVIHKFKFAPGRTSELDYSNRTLWVATKLLSRGRKLHHRCRNNPWFPEKEFSEANIKTRVRQRRINVLVRNHSRWWFFSRSK